VEYKPEEVRVDRFDRAPGWVVFMASDPPPAADQLPRYLSKAVSAWQKQTPSLKVRAMLPIFANADTIAIHVWFD